MKNNIDYFSHDSHSYQHNKFKMLRVEYGWEGYGKFWALNEIIAQSENCYLDISQKYNKASIASDLGFSINELDKFLDFLINECSLIILSDKGITTDRVQDVLEKVMKDRKRMQKQYEETKKTTGSLQEESKILREENIQSKVKESKVNNNIYIGDKSHGDIIDELEKFITYWNSNFGEQRKVTKDLISAYKAIRKKYSKEELGAGANKYFQDKKGIEKQYMLSPIKFFKQSNGLASYL